MFSHPYGWIAAGGFLISLLTITVCASRVIIIAHAKRIGSNDDAEVRIRALFGLIKFKYQIPTAKLEGLAIKVQEEISTQHAAGRGTWKEYNDEINPEKVVSSIEKMKQVLQLTRDLTGWLRKTMTKVELTKWNWSTSIGTGDAMWTAMATGVVWSVQSSVLGVLSQFLQLKAEPVMTVNPLFNRSAFATEWSCIAQIRFGYAILAGLQLLHRMKKSKGGVKAWQNILSKA
ncbi:hypothetical protein PAT3040_06939 [Paenibacillus agaridevorans]|uniref:DUF2953 domain-containing protein n=1 Tax=Paenibacillus agaridevorans TaxID=171404 RepID=A0A2R5F348_9BACL|nr:DUF2953 domain-containing protein [Paenibacillus agaridevorans]GBG12078.1 hypothetical protein PAT3040_06939 [Paenibacillus agaridevorans]